MRQIRDIQNELVNIHHLDSDFVRNVYAVIMDPSTKERDLCADLVAKNKLKSARRQLKNIL